MNELPAIEVLDLKKSFGENHAGMLGLIIIPE